MTRSHLALALLAMASLLFFRGPTVTAADEKPAAAAPEKKDDKKEPAATPAPAPAAGNLLKPADKKESWRLEQHEQAKGTLEGVDGAMVLNVTADDGTDWHVQAFQTPLDLKDGKQYVITFKAKADAERAIKVQAGIDEEDWHMIGLDEEINLTKEFKNYEFKFTANDVKANKNRVGFVVGQAKGKVYVKDLVLKAV